MIPENAEVDWEAVIIYIVFGVVVVAVILSVTAVEITKTKAQNPDVTECSAIE